MGAELLHAGRTARQNEINSPFFRNFANRPKNRLNVITSTLRFSKWSL